MDKHKIGQVIRNLISNSLKFCQKPGTVNIKVDVVSSSDLEFDTASKKRKSNTYKRNCCTRIPFMKSSIIHPITKRDDDCEYYFRVSVTDDGTGISEVIIIKTIFMWNYSFISMRMSYVNRKNKLIFFMVSFNSILVSYKMVKVQDLVYIFPKELWTHIKATYL